MKVKYFTANDIDYINKALDEADDIYTGKKTTLGDHIITNSDFMAFSTLRRAVKIFLEMAGETNI